MVNDVTSGWTSGNFKVTSLTQKPPLPTIAATNPYTEILATTSLLGPPSSPNSSFQSKTELLQNLLSARYGILLYQSSCFALWTGYGSLVPVLSQAQLSKWGISVQGQATSSSVDSSRVGKPLVSIVVTQRQPGEASSISSCKNLPPIPLWCFEPHEAYRIADGLLKAPLVQVVFCQEYPKQIDRALVLLEFQKHGQGVALISHTLVAEGFLQHLIPTHKSNFWHAEVQVIAFQLRSAEQNFARVQDGTLEPHNRTGLFILQFLKVIPFHFE